MYTLDFEVIKTGGEYGLKMLILYPSGRIIERVYRCISISKNEVENFISLLKRNNVSYLHVEDLIDDYFFSY